MMMALRSLLVHVDDSDACVHRLDVASRLARDFDAELIGVYLVPTAELTPTVAALLPDSIVEQRLRGTGDAQDEAEARFRDAAARAEVLAVEWRAPAGMPVRAIATHARGVDLSVIGQPDPHDPGASFAGDLATAALLATGRPALIVPYVGVRRPVAETVLVAWDHSRESARAIADALPLLARAPKVVVLAITSGREESLVDKQSGALIDAYLRRHDVRATVHHLSIADVDTGELLLSQCADTGADLLVMGAYGHTPLQELVLGGVTRTMLRRMTTPVLMSH
jgi:nucleotide-binding universal stress UspA family protein